MAAWGKNGMWWNRLVCFENGFHSGDTQTHLFRSSSLRLILIALSPPIHESFCPFSFCKILSVVLSFVFKIKEKRNKLAWIKTTVADVLHVLFLLPFLCCSCCSSEINYTFVQSTASLMMFVDQSYFQINTVDFPCKVILRYFRNVLLLGLCCALEFDKKEYK